LDDSAFDPKKLFDEEEYSTLVIKRDGFSNKQNTSADLIESLMDTSNTREENEQIFLKIKETNASAMLVKALQEVKKPSQKVLLASACWECGLDFSPWYLVFVELTCDKDFKLAFEALTVVENCEGTIDEDSLHKALAIAEKTKSPNTQLVADLMTIIKLRLS
jgi:hypothetical protein